MKLLLLCNNQINNFFFRMLLSVKLFCTVICHTYLDGFFFIKTFFYSDWTVLHCEVSNKSYLQILERKKHCQNLISISLRYTSDFLKISSFVMTCSSSQNLVILQFSRSSSVLSWIPAFTLMGEFLPDTVLFITVQWLKQGRKFTIEKV